MTDFSAYTEVVDGYQSLHVQTVDDTTRQRLVDELEQLDRNWQVEKESHLILGKGYSRRLPNKLNAGLLAVFGTGFGIIWLMNANGNSAINVAPLGLLIIGASLGSAIVEFTKAQEFNKSEQSYAERRNAIEQKMR